MAVNYSLRSRRYGLSNVTMPAQSTVSRPEETLPSFSVKATKQRVHTAVDPPNVSSPEEALEPPRKRVRVNVVEPTQPIDVNEELLKKELQSWTVVNLQLLLEVLYKNKSRSPTQKTKSDFIDNICASSLSAKTFTNDELQENISKIINMAGVTPFSQRNDSSTAPGQLIDSNFGNGKKHSRRLSSNSRRNNNAQ